MSTPVDPNRVKARRAARGWSQQELAEKAGLSRPGVSAIEIGRLTPSVTAALALSRALDCTVEELFGEAPSAPAPEWAIPPNKLPRRYWHSLVGGRVLAYPVEDASPQTDWHDGVMSEDGVVDHARLRPSQVLVVAGCDPAAGLLAVEYARQSEYRMIVLERPSREALRLLAEGCVHVAGLHLGDGNASRDNPQLAREALGADCELVRVARWEEGVAVTNRLRMRSIASLVRSKARWVGREPGSGARQCQDKVLGDRAAPRRIASNHRTVAAAVKCGWADAGPCLRLPCEEAGLSFVSVQWKNYDLAFRESQERDPRLVALVSTLRSSTYRERLAELPGYSAATCGELC